MIGMIALAGIIVRNSILLVDFINEELRKGVAFDEAVIRSGVARTKPIVLTALAAILGAFFILDDPIFSGLAVALIFGLLVSTLLTLIVIPVMYYAFRQNHVSARRDGGGGKLMTIVVDWRALPNSSRGCSAQALHCLAVQQARRWKRHRQIFR